MIKFEKKDKYKPFVRTASVILIITFLFSLTSCNAEKRKQKFTKEIDYPLYFDTQTVIVGYENDEESFNSVVSFIENELIRYHKLYDIYTEYDGINNLASINALDENGNHRCLKVDKDIIELLEYSFLMYDLTGGETNVALGSVLSIWHDARQKWSEGKETYIPSLESLNVANAYTDIDSVIIDKENSTVFLSNPNTTLDVGAIAKGYAVERIAQKLSAQGVQGYALNVGGNIRLIGEKPTGACWDIGIDNPGVDSFGRFSETVTLSDSVIVTSGSYQRYYVYNGVNYHHIIDKDTLMPADYYLSVSVIAKDSGLADALSTALFSMDIESGMSLVRSLDTVDAMWITKNGEKITSEGFARYVK